MASDGKPVVSFLGPIASYSHQVRSRAADMGAYCRLKPFQAARQAFSESEWELRPVVTIDGKDPAYHCFLW